MERFDTARMYLYRVLPWAPIGDPTVFVNLMWTIHGPGYKRPGWRGVPCQSIEECITAIQRAQRNPLVKDIYVCMSSQREYEIRTGDHGPYKVAKRSQENAHQMRSLFADVDVKEGAYATTQIALQDFSRVLKESSLPRPQLFVASGSGGFHVYWTLDRALSIAEWQPLANALAECLRRHGLKCDTQCTVDAARVLRVPETYNTKTAPFQLVQLAVNNILPHDYTVEQMRSVLAPYMGAQVIPLTPKVKNEAITSNLGSGIEVPQAPLINIQTVADAGCGFIREALAQAGAQYSNPLWNLTTLTSVFTEGGREDAHRMASGHSAYSREETDELFDRKTTEKEVKNLGWPSCQSVENAGCISCATCPLKSPGSRPLQFGRPTPAKLDPLGPLPHSYSRNPQGYIMQARKAKDGEGIIQVQVAPHPCKDAWLQTDPWSLHWHMRPEGQNWRVVSCTSEQMNSLEKFRAVMGKQGIVLNDIMDKDFRRFVVAWHTELQKVTQTIVSNSPYGWVWTDGKIDGFAYGGRIWSKQGDRPAGTADMEIARQYHPQGDLTAWKRAAQMVTDLKSPARDAMLAAAFAGPLVQFTGQEGLLVNAYSVGSGFGKSTTMKIAQAVWAKPALALNGLSDTQVSIFTKASIIKHLPIFWDEIKSDDDRVIFSKVGFQLSQGTDRSRANSDATLKKRGEWKTLIIAACNDSVADIMARQNKNTTAGVHRVFEFTLDQPHFQLSGAMADQLVLSVQSNYGHAGLEYAKWLGANHATVASEVIQVRESIEKKLQTQEAERFWSCSVVCLYLGAVYANKAGLTNIDTTALLKFLLQTYLKNRGALTGAAVDLAQERTTTDVLSRFLNDMRGRHTLVTDKIWSKAGKPPPNAVKVLSDAGRLDAIHVQATDDGHVRFARDAFRQWLDKNGYSSTAVEAYLKTNVKCAPVFCRLGAGTGIKTGQMWCYEAELKETS